MRVVTGYQPCDRGLPLFEKKTCDVVWSVPNKETHRSPETAADHMDRLAATSLILVSNWHLLERRGEVT
jgi:hypothetical protein